ncbi:MAG: biosynthetic-type acetolactate synthase large subunit [Clostridiales bacterium]|nr:biosynthetic-type acetolactate synthase large subunit [Clostridiales bacterium]MBS5878372.1 biosynthetic-type acetolactate synthase large subunit [Clostridiales bacterium]MDU0939844.1 biosynthetic-type acetolactate synthase large subunit [Clostridiales bacterium]MDU1042688.1 biosynthetic-type acetolactate synthase large subunit [Clostridiales bacterium]MDU3489535.1 biosynthetic-type acetolactate synthase large subunit [Clostridiales bacterium]
MKINGAEIIVECLKEQGVKTVFGYPGGTALNVYDALYKHADEIEHILTSHEQGASHAADGYARATGKVGVCFATSGPGATNLVTGIATAYMDSIPMVAITCNVNVDMLGRDTFQEIDIAGVTMPITKHNFIVKDVKDLAKTMRRAFAIAAGGRPGPVLVDVTKDVTANETEYTPVVPEKIQPVTSTIREEDIETAVKLISKSKRPYLFVGGGAIAAGASKELNKFAHLVNGPVTDSLMGKGAFDETDPLYTGMIGMHGSKTTNLCVSKADLLIVVGARFSDRVTGNTKTFAKNAKILHIDVDPAEINKNIRTYASVIGDANEVLKRINAVLPQQSHEDWLNEIEETRKKYAKTPKKNNDLTGPDVISKLYELTEGDAIIVTDVGQHQMWAAQNYKFSRPRTFLSSGGLGTMGYGLGAAIGAKIGVPAKTVVNIGGDGCFRMNMNEIATASRYGIPVIEVVLNNHVLGMVRQWQTLFYNKRYSNTSLDDNVDFVKVSEGLGAKSYRVESIDEFEAAFKDALKQKTPTMIECVIDNNDKVFPMVSPGASIAETFDENDLKEKSGGK